MPALTRGIGKQLSIGVAKEATRGSTPATITYWLGVSEWEAEERYNNAVQEQTFGVIEDSIGQTRVKNWADIQLKAPLGDASFPLFLYSMLGTLSSGNHPGETTVKDHVLTVAQTVQHQSLSFYLHDPITTPNGASADYTYANGVVSKLDIDFSLGKFIEYTATIKSLAGSQSKQVLPYVPAQTTENLFVPQYLTFKATTAGVAALAGTTAIKLKSAKISLDQNIEDDDVLGSVGPRDYLNKEFKAEGTLEAILQNESDFKVASIANTPVSLLFDMINSDTTIGVASSHPELSIEFSNVIFTEYSRPVKIKDIMYQTVKFKAHYSTSLARMIRATATNTVTSY